MDKSTIFYFQSNNFLLQSCKWLCALSGVTLLFTGQYAPSNLFATFIFIVGFLTLLMSAYLFIVSPFYTLEVSKEDVTINLHRRILGVKSLIVHRDEIRKVYLKTKKIKHLTINDIYFELLDGTKFRLYKSFSIFERFDQKLNENLFLHIKENFL